MPSEGRHFTVIRNTAWYLQTIGIFSVIFVSECIERYAGSFDQTFVFHAFENIQIVAVSGSDGLSAMVALESVAVPR